MKKLFYTILFVLMTLPAYSQVKVSFGMGIDLVHTSSLRDYVDYNFYDSENELNSFNKALSILGEVDYSLSGRYQIGFEYNHSFFFHSSDLYNNYELNFDVYKPSLIGYYVLPGDGYEIKFGAGAGYRYAVLEEKIYSKEEFTTSGVGFLIKAAGNTALGDNFYGYICVDMRYDSLGEPEGDSGKIFNVSTNENVNLNQFSFGLKLGVSYFFE